MGNLGGDAGKRENLSTAGMEIITLKSQVKIIENENILKNLVSHI